MDPNWPKWPPPTSLEAWPNCATPDCKNKRCIWSGEKECYQCCVRKVGKAEMDRRYEVTHPGMKADDPE